MTTSNARVLLLVAVLTGFGSTRDAAAVDGGGVTPIGRPGGLSAIYENPGPFSNSIPDPLAPNGTKLISGDIDLNIAAPLSSGSGQTTDLGKAFFGTNGVFWAEAAKLFGSSQFYPQRDGVTSETQWSQEFRKDTEDAWMTFTVTKAQLSVRRGPYFGSGDLGSRAHLAADGFLILKDQGYWPVVIYDAWIDLAYVQSGWKRGFGNSAFASEAKCPYTIDTDDIKELTCGRYTGHVDLSRVKKGEHFYILFTATTFVEASQSEGDAALLSSFRDPLEVGGGINIEVEGLTPLNNPILTPVASDRSLAAALQTDGKIISAGYAYSAASGNYQFALARYNADGSLDTSFGAAGKVTTDFGNGANVARAIALQPDGQIVVVGYASNGGDNDFAVVRYNADGSLDASFGASGNGKVLMDIGGHDEGATAVLVQPDGKILVAGRASNGDHYDFALARLNADGSPDAPGFGDGAGKLITDFAGAGDYADCMVLLSDGRIVVAGSTDSGTAATYSDIALARYNADGSLDTDFGAAFNGKVTLDLVGGSDFAEGLALQSDGKLIVAGHANNGVNSDIALARFDTSGNLDVSFGSGGTALLDLAGNDDFAHALAIQADDKIVIAGHTGNGTDDDFAIMRLHPNGLRDGNFAHGGQLTVDFSQGDDRATAATIQPDGHILVSGWAVTATGEDFALLRINP
jgi:uncharacterized delta-60 repeat protein